MTVQNGLVLAREHAPVASRRSIAGRRLELAPQSLVATQPLDRINEIARRLHEEPAPASRRSEVTS